MIANKLKTKMRHNYDDTCSESLFFLNKLERIISEKRVGGVMSMVENSHKFFFPEFTISGVFA